MKRITVVIVAVLAGGLGAPAADPLPRTHTNLGRLALDRLEAVHADVEKLRARRTDVRMALTSR